LRSELTLDLKNYVLDFLSGMSDNLNVTQYIFIIIQNWEAVLNQNDFSFLCISILLKELIVREEFILNSSDRME
jgi:hypothetical protein